MSGDWWYSLLSTPAGQKIVEVVVGQFGTAFQPDPAKLAERARAQALSDVETKKIRLVGEVEIEHAVEQKKAELKRLTPAPELPPAPDLPLLPPRAVEVVEVDDHVNAIDVELDFDDPKALELRSGKRLNHQELKRQKNIEDTIREGKEEAGDAPVSDQPVDEDWAARFFDGVQDVSNETMRKLWAKVLAGEVSVGAHSAGVSVAQSDGTGPIDCARGPSREGHVRQRRRGKTMAGGSTAGSSRRAPPPATRILAGCARARGIPVSVPVECWDCGNGKRETAQRRASS